ncbi:carbohydrate ABC transporter substrate-binding protein [Virgibacillus halodenitrificans]|uniref:carbohydrate ABC transporter substrate-binding protein n=1 Tax=Virgibacillus halodenitrificans TaxID=1482 RepID=UPI001FB47A86|nr:carbohydrate ABC transporter substrate-binding protein [Virgibacillus halodenitrificans]MCJ0930046.1 carbohydrate ABC transporter substrate-binding protein [Virgibacillus halodenitrificans]
MKMKHLLFALSALFLVIALSACSGGDDSSDNKANGENGDKDEETTLHVAALESAYGADMWKKVAEAYEATNENVKIEFTIEKNLEEVVRPEMQAGSYPDVFLLATDREEALTETLIKEKAVENLSDVLEMKVPGEEAVVKDKILDGFTDTLATNPYGDGETYLAPMFYSPTGLFYNESLFEEKGWEVPQTWDEMWELGDKAKEEGISLFTYPIAGYFDTLLGSMLYASGGPDFYNSAMTYEDNIWETKEAERVLKTVEKLGEYTHPNTVANANPNDFTKNQQLVLENKALFMPNGSWVVDEMKEAPRADGFEWGMAPVPAFEEGGDRYAFTFFEQIWIPSAAENKDAAKDFIAYMYSDEAADIFLEAGAVQPIEVIVEKLNDQKKIFYSVYENGALPAMGTFASTEPVPGASISDEVYGTIDSVISGKTTYEQWKKDIEEVSDKLRPAMK